MTLSVGKFYCKTCKITFEGEYKPQQRPRKSCPKCHKMADMSTNKKEILKKKKQSKAVSTSLEFIDDPDELLMSVAMRELNRPGPDPRWASILISVRKENIGKSKKEGNIRSKFKSLNIKDIAQIISQKEKNTSPESASKGSS